MSEPLSESDLHDACISLKVPPSSLDDGASLDDVIKKARKIDLFQALVAQLCAGVKTADHSPVGIDMVRRKMLLDEAEGYAIDILTSEQKRK